MTEMTAELLCELISIEVVNELLCRCMSVELKCLESVQEQW
jgi:hypothetical protein